MHIVIDAHLAVKQIDGVARYLNGLLTELPKVDPAIRYTILSLPSEASSLPEAIFANPNVQRVEINVDGLSPRQHLMMRGLLQELQADLYHHPQFDLPVGIGVPSVVTIHDLKYLAHPQFLKKKSRLKSLYIKKSLQHSLKAARQIIAVSKNTLHDLEKLFSFDKEKVSVIHHGVRKSSRRRADDKIVPPGMMANDFVLFVGTRRPHKNLVGLIEACHILRNRYRLAVDLVVAGKAYADYSEPEKTVRDLGMESHTHFLDFVPDRDLTALYRSARVVALVSFFEGFGLPLLEAMSYGTPVIGSNTTSIPEVIGDAGLLANPDDPNDIAQKIYQIISDEATAQKLSRAGLQRCKQFTWKSVAKSTLNVYNKALSS
ncbi:MAG: glycosyltransferase family 4 protein [bacterium]